MSLLQKQLKESILELESIQKGIEYSSQLTLRLAEEEDALKIFAKKLIKDTAMWISLKKKVLPVWLEK